MSSPQTNLPPGGEPIGALRVDNGNKPYDAAVAALPIPGKQRKCAATAGDLVDIPSHILAPENAVLEQDAMPRLPIRKVRLPVAAARPLLVFLGEMRMQRAVALRPDGSGKGVIVGLGVMPAHLHFFLDNPSPRRGHETRCTAEV